MNVFESIDSLKLWGFKGFIPIKTLINTKYAQIPLVQGIYIVVNTQGKINFLDESVGGHFKGRNPTVHIELLNSNLVENSCVLYIGKAGGAFSKATLRSRLKQYLRFGQGEPVGHWGGRLIWQIKNNKELLLCWKELSGQKPREIEKALIQEYINIYGVRPFANLKG